MTRKSTPRIVNVGAVYLLLLAVFVAPASSAISSSGASSCLPENPAVQYHPKAFTPAESEAIIQIMKQLPVQFDDRVDKSVKRTNYFDQGASVTASDSKYKWIFERILPLYAPDHDNMSMELFVASMDFILLHEFEGGGFFDWHVDVQPGDNTGRTNNINVMLTDRSQYEGGALTVGNSMVPAQQGDCYSYPASFPHKVADITSGRRHTFIIAMKSSSQPSSSSSTSSSLDDRQSYWEAAEANHQSICAANPAESKLHLLHGEFLAALGRPEAEVDAKFADMYASTPEAEAYCSHFLDQGTQLEQAGRGEESSGHFAMANMIRDRIETQKQ